MQLSQADLIQQNQHAYLISGTVDFSTVPELVQRLSKFFTLRKKIDNTAVVIDLSQVSSCNSAGLAMLLEMAKNAKKNNINLHFENLPEALQTIAKAYGVDNEIRDLCK